MKRLAQFAALLAAASAGCAETDTTPPEKSVPGDIRASDGSVGFRERIKATFPEAKIEFEEDCWGVPIARVWTTHPGGMNTRLTIKESEPITKDGILRQAEIIQRQRAVDNAARGDTRDIAWPLTPLDESERRKIRDRAPQGDQEINVYQNLDDLPYIEDQATFGKQHPHVLANGHAVDFDPEENWCFYAGTNVRAMWLEFKQEDGAAKRTYLDPRQVIGNSVYQFIPEEKVYRWVDKKAGNPE